MKIVYILSSKSNSNRFYVGVCHNLRNRLSEHNAGECKSTLDYRPWEVVVAIFLRDEKKANAFERYLKTGSGRAFSKRHF